MAAPLISQGEVEWLTSGVSFNCRNDGRGREDFRPLGVQLGVIAQATGSARVQLGETDVIVGVKVRGGARCAVAATVAACRRHLLPRLSVPLPLGKSHACLPATLPLRAG
jgi:hypothetical protein